MTSMYWIAGSIVFVAIAVYILKLKRDAKHEEMSKEAMIQLIAYMIRHENDD